MQWVANDLRMKPPGPFFFLMIASIATSMPFDLRSIPVRVGVVGMGAMLACVLALVYSAYIVRRFPPKPEVVYLRHSHFGNLIESTITALFMGGSLLTAHLLRLDNPYWVPISCLAVMQGVTLHHIWQRSLHRILGTFAGLGLTWLFLSAAPSVLTICLSIFMLQFVVEMLVVRHYGLAVIFITPLTILLAEAGSALSADPNILIPARMLDIALGSLIGAVAGWFLHHELLRRKAERQIRKSRVALLRKSKKR